LNVLILQRNVNDFCFNGRIPLRPHLCEIS
jgi:hypothetical protein